MRSLEGHRKSLRLFPLWPVTGSLYELQAGDGEEAGQVLRQVGVEVRVVGTGGDSYGDVKSGQL